MMSDNAPDTHLINPFENNIVSEPRNIDRSISRLNERALNELLGQFASLERGNIPRHRELSHAQLVTSPQPGYGKSHLIGRLFQELAYRATLVYLRPFEDVTTCWKTILLKVVQELGFPEQKPGGPPGGAVPTQLETFAHGVLAHMAASGFRKNPTVHYLLDTPLSLIRKEGRWKRWLLGDGHRNKFMAGCVKQLGHYGIRLNASPVSWINVLLACAYQLPSDPESKTACEDWLKGGGITMDEAESIGIRPDDMAKPDASSGDINQICKQRLTDFCRLAGFFRPFVFCFDQTEIYGKDPELARAFGAVVQALRDEVPNQMTVVTANRDPWLQRIKPLWEDAYLHRLSLPLELEALNREQAVELIEHRFSGLNAEREKRLFFSDLSWIDELLQGDSGGEIGVRIFLEDCNRRWRALGDSVPGNPPASSGTPPMVAAPTIEAAYQKHVEKIQVQPKRQVFDPSTLYWLVHEAAAGLPGLTVQKETGSKGYFTLVWKMDEQVLYFGFEGGAHWKRWEAITREAGRIHQRYPKTRFVLFRTPELPPIPGAGWSIAPEIEAAGKRFLHVLRLDKAELFQVYAGYDLYLDAVEGNVPFDPSRVVSFVGRQLSPLWERIRAPLDSRPNPPDSAGSPDSPGSPDVSRRSDGAGGGGNRVSPELIARVRRIMQEHLLLSVEHCLEKLGGEVPEELLHEARAAIPEIKVHVSPEMTVMQWQSNPSA